MLRNSIEVEKLITELTNKKHKIPPDERAQKLDQLYDYLSKYPIKKIFEEIEFPEELIEKLNRIISAPENLPLLLKKFASAGSQISFPSFRNFVKEAKLLQDFNPPLNTWVELIKAHKGKELNFAFEMLMTKLHSYNQFKQFLLENPDNLNSLLTKANPTFIRELFHDPRFAQTYIAKQDIKKLHQLPYTIFEAFAGDPACSGLHEFIAMHRNQDVLTDNIVACLASRQHSSFLEIMLPHLVAIDPKSPLAVVLNLSVLNSEVVNGFVLVQQFEMLQKNHPDQLKDFLTTNKDALRNYVRGLQAIHKALISMQSTPYFLKVIEFLKSKNFLDKSVVDIRNALKVMENKFRSISMYMQYADAPFNPLKTVDLRGYSRQLEKEKSQEEAKDEKKPLSPKEIAKIHIEQANISRKRKDELLARIDNPGIMDQERNALCGPTTFIMHLAAIDPVRYADLAIKLLVDKKVSIKNAAGDELVLANTYSEAKMENRSIDMIFLSALRRATNDLGIYASSKAVGSHAEILMGYTKPDDFVKWFQVFYGSDCPVVNTCQVYVEDRKPAPAWMQAVSGVKASPEYTDLAKNLETAIAEVKNGACVTMFLTMGLANQIVAANKKPGEIVRYDHSDDAFIPLVKMELAHYIKINALSEEIDASGKRFINIEMDTWAGTHKAKIPYKDFLLGYRGIISAHPQKLNYEDKPVNEEKDEKRRSTAPPLPRESMEAQRAMVEARLGGIPATEAKGSSAAPTLPAETIEEQHAYVLARLAGATRKEKPSSSSSPATTPSKEVAKGTAKSAWKQAASAAKTPAPTLPEGKDDHKHGKLRRAPAMVLPVMPFFSHGTELTQLYQELAIKEEKLERLKEIEPLLPKLEDGTDYFSARVLPRESRGSQAASPASGALKELQQECNTKIATLEKWQKFGYISEDERKEFLAKIILNTQTKLGEITKESTAGPAPRSPRKDS